MVVYWCLLENDIILGIGWNGWQLKWVCVFVIAACCKVIMVLRMKKFVFGFFVLLYAGVLSCFTEM